MNATKPDQSEERAKKLLAAAYPEMVESLAAAIARGLNGSEVYTFHLCEGDPSRFQANSSYTKTIR